MSAPTWSGKGAAYDSRCHGGSKLVVAWPYHLEIALGGEKGADGPDDLDALAGAVERLGVVDQIEVAVPQPVLLVLHAAPLVGVRQQRFAENRELLGEDRRLPAAGLAVGALHADQVAEV